MSFTRSVTELLIRRSRVFVTALGCLLVLLVGAADYVTRWEVSFALLYLGPIALVAWFAGRWPGVGVSICGAISGYLADWLAGHTYSHPVVPWWNAVVQLGLFLVVAGVLSQLQIVLARAKASSRTDPLTGVANRRYFYEAVRAEVDRAHRYHHPLSIAYLRVENFEAVVRGLGRSIGDDLLRLIAKTIKDNIRVIDFVARFGDDQFAILLPEVDAESAETILRRLRKILAESTQDDEWPVKFNIGVAVFLTPPGSAEEVIGMADDLMYAAKRGDRDTIEQRVFGK